MHWESASRKGGGCGRQGGKECPGGPEKVPDQWVSELGRKERRLFVRGGRRLWKAARSDLSGRCDVSGRAGLAGRRPC